MRSQTIVDFGMRIAEVRKGVGRLPETRSPKSEALFSSPLHASLFTLLLLSLPVVSLADYVGLEVIDRSDLTICQDPPLNLKVCDLAVILNNSADRLISVAFSNVSTTDPAGFYQHTFGADTAPGCIFLPVFPTLVCDSFVTLGEECDDGDASATDPDFDSTAFNSSGTVSGGWLNSNPTNSQGAPDANDRVMIGRFSYKENKTTSGDVCVFTKLAGSEEITSFLIEPFDCSVTGMQAGTGDDCAAGMVWYVDIDNTPGANSCCTAADDCNGWANACPDLQDVLDNVDLDDGDQIWVAEGTYRPSDCTSPCKTSDRLDSFQLASCLEIYGGFEGNETMLSERNWVLHETILSGDLEGDDAPEFCNSSFPDCNDFGRLCLDGSCITPKDNGENSYHVVSASNLDETAILDGFTISGGNANGTGAQNQGSAVHIVFGARPTLVNCTFRQNWSDFHATVNDHGGATLIDCTFRENHSADFAGGLYVHSNIGTIVTRCDFHDNTAASKGAGAYLKAGTNGPDPAFTDCTFSGNQTSQGAGMYCGADRSPTLTGCTFTNNDAVHGCAIFNNLCDSPRITGCTFTGHHTLAPTVGYGAAIYNIGANAVITDCTFVDGLSRYGSGVYTAGTPSGAPVPAPAHTKIINCIFVNNEADGLSAAAQLGGAIFAEEEGSVTLTSCLFVANRASDDGGGAVAIWAPTRLTATNCTFVANSTAGVGGGVYFLDALSTADKLDNCLFWDNEDDSDANAMPPGPYSDESAQIHFASSGTAPLTYTDIMGLTTMGPFCDDPDGTPPCEGNIDADPTFVAAVTGTWTANGVYDAATRQSTFTHAGAAWTVNEHVGLILEPNITTPTRQSLIAANDASTITVWGDLAALGSNGDDYRIHDYRLDSAAGSPCIDAADNNAVTICSADLDGNERFVDDPATTDTGGGDFPFVDMGAYEFGADPELYCNGSSIPYSCCKPDIDGDGAVSAFDLASLLAAWGSCDPCLPGVPTCDCPGDINNDCNVGAFDLASLLASWGPCQ